MSARLWVNRNFRLLFASALATNLGDGLIAVAMPWLATLLTEDPLLIGLVAAARHIVTPENKNIKLIISKKRKISKCCGVSVFEENI